MRKNITKRNVVDIEEREKYLEMVNFQILEFASEFQGFFSKHTEHTTK